jgi:pimeloyl-ACP methyl ester carboxylesterase
VTLAEPVGTALAPRITLVLLPGMDGTGDLFAPFVAALGTGFDVVVVRYPPTEALDYAALERVARAALPTNAPFVLLGESFSGPIAVSIAASRPQQLLGLILCCSFVRNPRPFFSRLRAWVGVLPLRWVPVWLLGAILLGRFANAGLRADFARSLAQVSADVLKDRIRAVLAVDVSASLSVVDVATLYLRAAHDRIVPPAASRLVSALRPETRIVQLEAPHFLLQAAPAEAAARVGDFVREVRNAATSDGSEAYFVA